MGVSSFANFCLFFHPYLVNLITAKVAKLKNKQTNKEKALEIAKGQETADW